MNLIPFLIMARERLPSLDPYSLGSGEKADLLNTVRAVCPGNVEYSALSAISIRSNALLYDFSMENAWVL